MASSRSYNVRYGTKGAYRPKVRPWHSTSADLFDRLKGSVDTPKDTSLASSLSEQEGQSSTVDEDSSCGESPLQIRRRTASHTRAMYSYSHSSRTTSPAKSILKASARHIESSPTSLTTTSSQQPSSSSSTRVEEDRLASEAREDRLKKKQDAKKVDEKDHLKVFDFELSSDEDSGSKSGSVMKKARIHQKSLTDSRKPVVSRKQTSLKQYARSADVRSVSQMSGGGDKKTAKKLKKVANSHKPVHAKGDDNESTKRPPKVLKNQKPSESDLRSTISKLLASKAEGLKAKTTSVEQVQSSTAMKSPCDVTSVMSDLKTTAEEKEQAVESVNRRVKRKSPPTAAVAAKKAPSKRAKIESNNLVERHGVESQMLSASKSGNPELTSEFSESSPQAKLTGMKTNDIYSSGTLQKSNIATRTRSSIRERKVGGKDSEEDQDKDSSNTLTMAACAVPNDSQHESLVGSDLTDSQSSQKTDVDPTESPRSSVSSSSESVRAGRPSPRYTARSRRMSGVSPTLQRSGSDIPTSGNHMSPSEEASALQGARPAKVNPAKGNSDPYGFDLDQDVSEVCKADHKKYLHVVQPKPSLRKSSSATSYSLTSHNDLSDAQPSTSSRLKAHTCSFSSLLSSCQSTTASTGRGDAASGMTVESPIPSLKKSSSWPLRPAGATRPGSSSGLLASHRMQSKSSLPSSSSSTGSSSTATTEKQITCAREEKQLYTVVRNVRQAHECLEIGESQQFFDEVHYLLDSIKHSQPLSVRCLGVFNLCTHYFDTEFSRQLRAHSLTPKITALLKDCLQHPTLCLSTAVLFYVMTRDKLNTEWDNSGAALLVGMLSKEESFFTSDLSTGKAQREMTRLRNKAKTILQKVKDQTSASVGSSSGVDDDPSESNTNAVVSAGEGGLVRGGVEAFGRGGGNHGDILKEKPHHVNPDHISVQELACECLISLTHHQHNPQWLRHQLRLLGGLDLVANLVISGIDGVSSVDVSSLHLCSKDGASPSDYVTGISYRLVTLERRMKALEHATVRNKDNQSYLVVFDGSVLLSEVIRLVAILPDFLKVDTLRSISEDCILTAFKVLLNLTHDLQLGCHRLGEQNDIMIIILDILFQLSTQMSDEENAFDITVLALSLLINLTEMCSSNRTLLESTKVPWIDSDIIESEEVIPESKENICSNNSSVKLLVQLFLERFCKAESTQIQVPTPQRLSQLTSSSTPHTSPSSQTSQQPQKPETSFSKRDLLPSFTTRMQKAPLTCPQGEAALSQGSVGSQDEGGLSWVEGGMATRVPNSGDRTPEPRSTDNQSDSEEEEAVEKVNIDPLVFSREEFDAALHQAGRHMEDSIVAAYTALLLGILSKHNQATLDYVRSQMPSHSFSEMIGILTKLVSFMNMTGSATGLESIKHIIKYLETL